MTEHKQESESAPEPSPEHTPFRLIGSGELVGPVDEALTASRAKQAELAKAKRASFGGDPPAAPHDGPPQAGAPARCEVCGAPAVPPVKPSIPDLPPRCKLHELEDDWT